MAWLTGWSYRKSHGITGSVGAETEYQMKIVAHYGSGSDSGVDVYLDSKSETDFGDIRFTDGDGSTELSYWMESKTDSDVAVFWVKVTDDLDSNQTIYIYYGKSGETTTSNGGNTFLFFDDFSGDLSKWNTVVGNPVIENGLLKLTSDGVESLNATGDVGYNHALRAKVQASTTSAKVLTRLVYEKDTTLIYHSVGFQTHPSVEVRHESRDNDGTGCGTYVEIASRDTDFHIFEVTHRSDKTRSYLDGVWKNDNTCVPTSPRNTLHPALQEYAGIEARWDWVFTRKFIDPEPVHGAWGAEEVPLKPSSSSIVTIMGGIGMLQTRRKSILKPFTSRTPKFSPRVVI